MKHGSLFSGIGGFDLAAQWMGWENVFHCEWNEFGQKVLNHYWPNAISYEDITKTEFTIHRGKLDILTGGFPCQPYSSAGKRKGKEDDRHLWPEMLRAIREIRPRWIVGENVLGLTNWNEGMVFEEVCADLEAEGYEVQPFILPAASVNAPHRRDRVWFVAHADFSNDRRTPRQNEGEGGEERIQERNSIRESFESSEIFGDASNTDSFRLQQRKDTRKMGGGQSKIRGEGNQPSNAIKANGEATNASKPKRDFENFPTQPPICGGNDGLPQELDRITFPKWRNESIKAYGNAIVPQVVYQIFKAIDQYEN